MRIYDPTSKRVYVTATDARTKKSRCLTVEGMTPAQFIRFVKDQIERQHQEQDAEQAPPPEVAAAA